MFVQYRDNLGSLSNLSLYKAAYPMKIRLLLILNEI